MDRPLHPASDALGLGIAVAHIGMIVPAGYPEERAEALLSSVNGLERAREIGMREEPMAAVSKVPDNEQSCGYALFAFTVDQQTTRQRRECDCYLESDRASRIALSPAGASTPSIS